MGRNSVCQFVRLSIHSLVRLSDCPPVISRLTLGLCWVALRPLQLALKSLQLALRPLLPAFAPLQLALISPGGVWGPARGVWRPVSRVEGQARSGGRTVGQTDEWTNIIFPHSTGLFPLSGSLPGYPLRLHNILWATGFSLITLTIHILHFANRDWRHFQTDARDVIIL